MVDIINSKFNRPLQDDSSKKIPVQHRETEFKYWDSLNYLADQHGMAVMMFYHAETGWVLDYFKANSATKPELAFCRDAQDYDLKVDIWMKECTLETKPYATFEEMVLGEIARLKEMLL